jgi:uncharacterized protein YifE (UPF0438 family)
MQRGLKVTKCQSTMTKKTWDKRIVICHESTSDENALIMICERDEKPQPSATACWKINMACHAAKLRTHALNYKKQASKGLMKIANDWQ